MKTKEPWGHFDEAFRAMDRGFRSIDWREMQDVNHCQSTDYSDPLGRKTHTIKASSWKSRRRIAGLFLWLAWRVITRGRVTVRL